MRVVITNITNIAVTTGIYGVGEPAQSREAMFNQIEAEWSSLRSELVERGDLRGSRRSLWVISWRRS
jgi:hypothetical protein